MDKALIVCIAEYGQLYGQPLTGARNALALWKTALTKYFGFTTGPRTDPSISLHILESAEATRDAILEELEWLVDGAGQDDRVVFIVGSHGTMVNRRDPRDPGKTYLEQGLVTYPHRGNRMDDTLLFGDQIAGVIRSSPVRITAVIDSCYGQGIFDELKWHAKRTTDLDLRPLSIDASTLGFDASEHLPTLEFNARLDQYRSEKTPSSIVIMSGARGNKPGFEGKVAGTRHLLFSYHLVQLLDIDHKSSTYTTLRDALLKQLAGLQTPQLQGNSSRYASTFTE